MQAPSASKRDYKEILVQTDSIDGGNGNKNRYDDSEDDKGDINWPQWVPEFLRLDYGDIATVSDARNFTFRNDSILLVVFSNP